jgi:hypothetical protein
MAEKEIETAFYESRRSNALPLVINDAVEILAGAHKGKHAAVISIRSVEPELVYNVEFGDGSGDASFAATLLKRI